MTASWSRTPRAPALRGTSATRRSCGPCWLRVHACTRAAAGVGQALPSSTRRAARDQLDRRVEEDLRRTSEDRSRWRSARTSWPAPERAGARSTSSDRFLLKLLVRKEIKVRYRGSVLGLLWSYVKPGVQFSCSTLRSASSWAWRTVPEPGPAQLRDLPVLRNRAGELLHGVAVQRHPLDREQPRADPEDLPAAGAVPGGLGLGLGGAFLSAARGPGRCLPVRGLAPVDSCSWPPPSRAS